MHPIALVGMDAHLAHGPGSSLSGPRARQRSMNHQAGIGGRRQTNGFNAKDGTDSLARFYLDEIAVPFDQFRIPQRMENAAAATLDAEGRRRRDCRRQVQPGRCCEPASSSASNLIGTRRIFICRSLLNEARAGTTAGWKLRLTNLTNGRANCATACIRRSMRIARWGRSAALSRAESPANSASAGRVSPYRRRNAPACRDCRLRFDHCSSTN